MLEFILTRCATDKHITESACRTLRLGIKAAGPESAVLFTQTVALIANAFRAAHHPAFL